MKRIITLFFVLATLSFSFAQSSAALKVKRSAKEAPITLGNVDVVIQPRAIECIWESDFSDASDWVLDHDASDCSLDWEIGQDLECGGFYPISPIESANGYYAMVDSDEYGGEEGGTETEDAWMTMSTSVDCSNYDNVIVEFDTWYRSWTYEKCFLVVSTDGTFPDNLTPDSDEDPANGIYEIFPGISGDGGAEIAANPTTQRINITQSAGGQSQVWVRFNWTGTWGYAWFIDRVCVAQQPSDDISLAYGVVTHNGTGEEYGRVPFSQVGTGVTCGAGVYNFGVNSQNNVGVDMMISGDAGSYGMLALDDMLEWDGTEYVSVSGPLASSQNVYFEEEYQATLSADRYTATFTVESSGDSSGGDYFSDNSVDREFEITQNTYSTDGIGVYDNPSITRMGTGSFLDAADGFMMMSYYDVSESTDLTSVEIFLDSYAYTTPMTAEGGELVVTVRDTANVFAEEFDVTDFIAESDFIYITQEIIDAGVISVPMDVTLSPNAYYIAVEMYSNENDSDTYILDDETIPQPSYLSMIYIPGDQVYTNGTAAAIRMVTSDDAVSIEEELSKLNIYPNPSNGIVNIELKEAGTFSIEVNDILGKVVSKETISSSKVLDLQNLEKGVYFINVSNNEAIETTKIVIE